MRQQLKIVISGASSGIGLTTALHLLARGHQVVGTSRHPERYTHQELKQKVQDDHGRYRLSESGKRLERVGTCLPKELTDLDGLLDRLAFVALDSADPASVASGSQQALAKLGGQIDVLWSNAGIAIFGPVEEISEKSLRQQFEINVFGTVRLWQQFLPVMRAQGSGKILVTSSIGALMGIPFQSHYSATKSAIERLAEGLALEVEPFGIQVAVVAPGDINTSFNRTTVDVMGKVREPAAHADMAQLLAAFPLNPSSSYFQRAARAWNYIIRTLPLKPSPTVVARLVVHLAEAKKLHGLRYHAGEWSQLVLPLATRLIPSKLALTIMGQIYELDRKEPKDR